MSLPGFEDFSSNQSEYRLFRAIQRMVHFATVDTVIRIVAAAIWKTRRVQFKVAHKVFKGDYSDRDIYLHPSILHPSILSEEHKEDCDVEGYNGECLDHSEIWKKSGKPYLMTSQPYYVTKEDLKKLIAHCDRYDINFQIDADSFYYPGHTIRILFKHKRVDKRTATLHQHQKVTLKEEEIIS